MTGLSKSFWLACVGILMQAFAFSAYPFAILGENEFSNPVAWHPSRLSGGLSYAIDPNFLSGTPGATDAVRNAFNTWDVVSPIIDFVEVSGSSAQPNPFLGANIDIFSRDSNFQYGTTRFNGALAIAIVAEISGSIYGAEIYFNEGYEDPSTNEYGADLSVTPGSNTFDVESIAVHEIGHILGLDHPDKAVEDDHNYDSLGTPISNTESEVMHSELHQEEIRRTLTGDEIAGLYYLYPSDYAFDSGITVAAITPAAVPAPATALLIIAGILLIMGLRHGGLHGASGVAQT